MNTYVIVLAVCVVGVLAENQPDEHKAKLEAYKKSCVDETKIDEAVLEGAKKGTEVENDEKFNCFSACMFKKTGIMKPDGSLDEEVARSKLPHNLPKEKADEIIKTCKAEAGKDVCETGGKVMNCLIKMEADFIIP